MARPKKWRLVSKEPKVTFFKPHGVQEKTEVILPVDGFEALRLTDVEGLEQDAAAKLMGISRQTYGRILAHARQLVAQALVFGKPLRIKGGQYKLIGE